MLQQLGPSHPLRQEVIAAAAVTDRPIAGRATLWREPLPSTTTPNGHAVWHAAERHAVTLYRRAVGGGLVDQHDPAVESALQQRGTGATLLRRDRGGAADVEHPAVGEALARIGAGQPLREELRRALEEQLGADFRDVRVHTDDVADEAANAVAAVAFTVGEDIFFQRGAFAPDDAQGRELLLHELTHVRQAQDGRVPQGGGPSVSDPAGPLEREAAEAARNADSSSLDAAVRPATAKTTGGAMILRTPQPGQAATAQSTLAQTPLAVAAGGRSYQISVVRRGTVTLIVAQLTGTQEKFEVPLPSETARGLTATFTERLIQPDQSSLDIGVSGGGGTVRHYRVNIVPSPYEAAGSAGRPDRIRIRISNGTAVVEKDLYPAGSANRLSQRDARFSTVAQLPPSGRSTNAVNMVVEVGGASSGRGAVVTLNLQKTGERRSVPVDVALDQSTIRLVGQERLAPDRPCTAIHAVDGLVSFGRAGFRLSLGSLIRDRATDRPDLCVARNARRTAGQDRPVHEPRDPVVVFDRDIDRSACRRDAWPL